MVKVEGSKGAADEARFQQAQASQRAAAAAQANATMAVDLLDPRPGLGRHHAVDILLHPFRGEPDNASARSDAVVRRLQEPAIEVLKGPDRRAQLVKVVGRIDHRPHPFAVEDHLALTGRQRLDCRDNLFLRGFLLHRRSCRLEVLGDNAIDLARRL